MSMRSSTRSAVSWFASATRRSANCGRCGMARRCWTRWNSRFSRKVCERHIMRALTADPFHVSANADPKGDRSKRPQEQDPDMLLHVVKETDAGIVVRGAKYKPRRPMRTRLSSSRRSATGATTSCRGPAWGGVHRRHGLAGHQAYLPHRVCRPRAGGGLSAMAGVGDRLDAGVDDQERNVDAVLA